MWVKMEGRLSRTRTGEHLVSENRAVGWPSMGCGCGSNGDMAEGVPRRALVQGCEWGHATLRPYWLMDHLVEYKGWIKPWMGVWLEFWVQFPTLQKQMWWINTYIPSTQEEQAGGLEVQVHPWLYNKFSVNLGNRRCCCK